MNVIESHTFKRTFETKAEAIAFIDGFCQALEDFGIWRDGVRRIGCLETPVQEVIAEMKSLLKD